MTKAKAKVKAKTKMESEAKLERDRILKDEVSQPESSRRMGTAKFLTKY